MTNRNVWKENIDVKIILKKQVCLSGCTDTLKI